MPRCSFCGVKINLTFLCNDCNSVFCSKHRNPNVHKCSSVPNEPIIDSTDTDDFLFEPTPLPNLAKHDYFTSADGKIILDINVISQSTRKLIEYYQDPPESYELNEDKRLSELVRRNLYGIDLINEMRLYLDHQLIEGLINWLSKFGKNPTESLTKLSVEHRIPINEMSLLNIVEFYYSALYDASFLEYVEGYEVDPVTFAIESPLQRSEVKMKSTIITTSNVLTEISEHARQSGDRESFGYLIGIRDPALGIEEITKYSPLSLGGEGSTIIDIKSLAKIMLDLKDKSETIVGAVHSHPYKGVPTYSKSDRTTHQKLSRFFSIYEYLKLLDLNQTSEKLLFFSLILSNYKFFEVKPLLEAFYATSTTFSKFKEVLFQISNQKSHSRSLINNQIEKIRNREKIKQEPVHFHMIPQVGVVICPWMRQIAMIDCIYDEITNDPNQFVIDWFYYRIGIKIE